ncbi:microfibrillar-associated 1-like protein [Babesia ovata]|uniref:Microfibrillar-associated 1-like protein n=1 Tax=Babesia ovata TaxID=189622 RepID=A0A2H6KFD0_9APIC|nr:microfibrillar-associated 1-like protein [Babesia ovata]GBE61700.1 microfibrillar-associated 1-like protein [Babesia ovata]
MEGNYVPAWLPAGFKVDEDRPRCRISPIAHEWLRRIEDPVCKCRCCALTVDTASSNSDGNLPRTEDATTSNQSTKPRMHDWVDVCGIGTIVSSRHSGGDAKAGDGIPSTSTSMVNRYGALGKAVAGKVADGPGTPCTSTPGAVSLLPGEADASYHCALRWLGSTLAHLDALERLSFGQEFRCRQLYLLSNMGVGKAGDDAKVVGDTGGQNSPNNIHSSIATLLRQWIAFDNNFRQVYGDICRAYNRLVRMEVQLNLLRTNSLLMLEEDSEHLSASRQSMVAHNDYAVDSERYGKLVSIWSSKLVALRDRNLSEFRHYVVSAVADLQSLPVPRALVFVEECESERSLVMSSGEDTNAQQQATSKDSASFKAGGTSGSHTDFSNGTYGSTSKGFSSGDHGGLSPYGSFRTTSVDGVLECTLDVADEDAECFEDECPADYTELFAEAVDVVTDYCQSRGISEESSLDYVSRVSDLSNRLLPRVVRAAASTPIHSDDYLDASVHCLRDPPATCDTQGASASIDSSTGAAVRLVKRDAGNSRHHHQASTARIASDISSVNSLSSRSARSSYDDGLPAWASKNRYVAMLLRTNLTVVDALRCLPTAAGGCRKLVCFTNGSLRDLFLNQPGAKESVDLRSLLASHADGTFMGDHGLRDDVKATAKLRSGPETVLRALLTEDLASDEIDKIIHTWFPTLSYSPYRSVPESGGGINWRSIRDALAPLDNDDASDDRGDADYLHSAVWRHRLSTFNALTGLHVSRLLTDRTLVEPRVKYDSGGYAATWDFLPLRSTCDFRNHIPIKYTMRSDNNHGGNNYGWMQSLFGGDGAAAAVADGGLHPNVSSRSGSAADMLPIACTGNPVNAVVIPIHRGPIELSDAYRTMGEMCDCLTDYVFPPLYEQHRFACVDMKYGSQPRGAERHGHCDGSPRDDDGDMDCVGMCCELGAKGCVDMGSRSCQDAKCRICRVGNHRGASERCSKADTADKSKASHGHCCSSAATAEIDTSRLGNVFVSRHSNLCLGSQWSSHLDRGSVSLVFYIVCCEGADATSQPLLDPGSHESILNQAERMRPVLSGLDRILNLCTRWKVATLSLPAALSCCFRVDGGSCGTDSGASEAYIRCLATATHLTAGMCRRAYPVAVNLVFPEALRGSGVEKAASIMSALELFRLLGEDLNRPPSPPRDALKRRRVSQAPRATRYWPGKAPDYAADLPASSDDDSDAAPEVAQAALENDRRYSRYATASESGEVAARSGRRRAPAATIVIDREPEHDADIPEPQPSSPSLAHATGDDGDVVNTPVVVEAPRNRAAIRSRAMAYRREEEAVVGDREDVMTPLDGEEEYSESDDDSDGSEHISPQESKDHSGILAKPVFVPKNRRLTVLEKQELEREEQRRLECERQRAIERQKQSKELLVQTLVASETQQEVENDVEMVDDTDELTEKEYELWKIRELKRVLRDRDERTAHERLMEEVERRRNMTEEERLADDERIDREKVPRAPRGKMLFLQKYYHKGAFFMDKLEDGSEPLYNRDFNAPTADDRVDKSLMPKSMQVRRGLYGKMGQVKHTHLTAEDTTRFDMPWNKVPEKFTPAGTQQTFDRPSRKKSGVSRSGSDKRSDSK